MNLKYYLRGLGMGLFVTTIVLTIAHNFSNSQADENDKTQPSTTGSVIAYTKEDKKEETTTQPTRETETAEQQSKQNVDENTVTIDFKEVSYGSEAAKALYDAGVISDQEEFENYLREHDYDTKIKDGIYTLTKGDTFENLAKTITKLD